MMNTQRRQEFLSSGGDVRWRASTAPRLSPVTRPPMCAALEMPGTTAPKNRLYPANDSRLLRVALSALGGTGSRPRYNAEISRPAIPKIAPEAPASGILGCHHRPKMLPAI